MVFYRKYRSQTVEDLDLTEVREKLTSILQSKEIPHAFLFTGPRGLGKTSAARILAKAINCEKRNDPKNTDFEPCNKCQSCISITNGSHIDVLEIDAASNRGIDEIRSLREKVKFSASSARKKIYIIDEVHMLTTEAFNALLKTLEEPPSHVVFVLCTTESAKIPQTILSRVFVVQFSEPKLLEIKKSLQRIADGEKLEIEEDVYNAVYQRAQGSFRDAHKFLEELVNIAGEEKKITAKLVDEKFHLSSIDQSVNNLLDELSRKNSKNALAIVSELNSQGSDFLFVTSRIVEVLREHMLYLTGFDSRIKKSPFSLSETGHLLEMVNNSYRLIKTSAFPYLPFELVVIEWCTQEVYNTKHYSTTNGQSLDKKDLKTSSMVERDLNLQEASSTTIKHAVIKGNLDNKFLYQLIDAVKLQNQTAAALLRSCKIKEQSDDTITLETAYEFHKEKLTDRMVQSLIEDCLFKLLNKKTSLQIVIHTG